MAGAPITDEVLKCSLKPVDPADYAPQTLTGDELTQLQAIFPTGVCNYSVPGAWQLPLEDTWLSY